MENVFTTVVCYISEKLSEYKHINMEKWGKVRLDLRFFFASKKKKKANFFTFEACKFNPMKDRFFYYTE